MAIQFGEYHSIRHIIGVTDSFGNCSRLAEQIHYSVVVLFKEFD
jgi:hypothetical protein